MTKRENNAVICLEILTMKSPYNIIPKIFICCISKWTLGSFQVGGRGKWKTNIPEFGCDNLWHDKIPFLTVGYNM